MDFLNKTRYFLGVSVDNEIKWRLINNEFFFKKSIKNKSIVYHIHHPVTCSEEGLFENLKIFDRKTKNNNIRFIFVSSKIVINEN